MATLLFRGTVLYHCNKCGHVWKPHKDSSGSQCPKCQSRYWNKPKPVPSPFVAKHRITKVLLEQAIASFNGHAPTLEELGDIFGVSGERIRQICKRTGIKRPKAATANALHCTQCNGVISSGSPLRRASGLCIRCKPELRPTVVLTLICGQCQTPFPLPQREYNGRMRSPSSNRLRTTVRTWPLFCSRQCSGRWFGTHYGGNFKRKELCKRGHKLEGVTPAERLCRPCQAIRSHRMYLAKKARAGTV